MIFESTKAPRSTGGVTYSNALGLLGRSLGLVLALLVCPLRSEAVSASVLVASVSGKVKALSVEDEFEVTLGKEFLGREISVNSMVTTGLDGSAALLFSNGVIVTLQPNSRLYLKKFVQVEFSKEEVDLSDLEKEPSTSQLELHLDFGNLVVKAPKLAKGSSVRLTSPIGTAGIRGTIFQVVVSRNAQTGAISGGVNLLSGELEFTSLSGDITSLASGEGMQFGSNRLGAQVSAVTGEIMDLVNRFVSPSPPWRPDVRLPGEAPLVPVEEPTEEELPEIPPPMSIQEISSLILFTLEEAEEAVSKFTVDMLENPVSVAAPLTTLRMPSPPAVATTVAGDLFINQVPAISLVGALVLEVDLGEPFIDPGATALDFGGNDISGGVTVTGSVDVNVAGTYSLTYVVSDLRGFQSTASRSVRVGDFTSPSITLVGDASITHEAGETFTDLGATAADVLAGQTTDLTTDLVAKLTFDEKTSRAGSYSIIYTATDAAGNEATATRTVTIVDTTSPEIALNNPFLGGEGFDPMFIDVGALTAYADIGATASDSFDGDLTASIDVDDEAKAAINSGDMGDFTITYSITDAAGNSASVSRFVIIAGNDNEGPTIRLAGKASATNSAHDPDPDNGEWKQEEVTAATHEVGDTWEEYGFTAFKKQGNKTFDYTDDVKVSGFVNSGTLDSYTLTYTVKDEFQNQSIVIRTVTVIDTTAPVITALDSNGSYDLTVEAGTPYADPGATAVETYDESDVAVTTTYYYQGGEVSEVDTSVTTALPVDYTVEYNAVDESGNAATAVTRKVTVVDTIAPIITLVGEASVDHEAPNAYTESGATASDSFEGDLSSGIVIGGDTVDPNALGVYTITYNVADASGNTATQVTRVVRVVDTTAPEIILEGLSEMPVVQNGVYTDPGFAASDTFRGDLTSEVVIGGDTVDPSTPGDYVVTYDVTDESGNDADQVSRTVIVATLPTITLDGGDMDWEAGTTFVEPGYVATDLSVGDRTSSVVATPNFDETYSPGEYSVFYTVTNTAGNYEVTATRRVTIVDTTPPVITLNNPFLGGEDFGRMLIDLNASASYPDPGATALDSFDGDVTASISVDDANVSTAITEVVPGDYTIRYEVTDDAGNSAEPVYRYVTLTGNDETGPVITLTGDSNYTMEVGTTWVEPGYTATKTIGSKIFDYTGDLLVTGSVNAAVVATYTLTYTVQDEYLNETTTTRTVNVVDTTPPSITRTPDANVTHEGGYAYDDPGATAFDEYDGDLTSSILVSGDDFITTDLGDHNVTYTVQDSSSNVATAVRIVTVVDTTKPVITLIDSTTGAAYTGLAVEYVDQDLTNPTPTYEYGMLPRSYPATDLVDGNVTADVIITGSVDLNDSAAHVLTYSVTDESGNVSDAVTRTVYVLDKDKPTIFLDTSQQTVELGSIFLHETATAVDNVDGDLSSSVSVTIVKDPDGTPSTVYSGNQLGVTSDYVSSSRTEVTDIDNIGTYEFTYSVSDNAVDADNNPDPNAADPVVRRVVVADTLPPVIPTLVTLEVDEHTDPRTESAFDLAAAVSDITADRVYDSDGNGSVQYFDLTDPDQLLNHLRPYVILYDLDDTTIITLNADGSFAKDIKEQSGEYRIIYRIEDYSENVSAEITRTVNVKDKTPPTITLIGNQIIHDFFRYDTSFDANASVPSDGTTGIHPQSTYDGVMIGESVGLSGFHPDTSFPLTSPPLQGEHDYILAPYNFTDPGAFAEDNRDWRPANYPNIENVSEGNGELYFIEDLSAAPSGSLEKSDRIYRYSQVAAKPLKEWQKNMEDGNGSTSNNALPDATENFDATNKAPGNYENVLQMTIYYYVRDEAGNQAQAIRTVYLYESFKFSGYAFYATPLNNVSVSFDPFGDAHDENNQTATGIGSRRTDMDGDGLSDFWEEQAGTNPKNPDSDGDGWTDLQEFKNWVDDPTGGQTTPNDPFGSL